MRFIDEVEINHKCVLLRVDFNVSLKKDGSIADDSRIRESLKTIRYLLDKDNKLIIVSHLGRPDTGGVNSSPENKHLSLEKVTRRLRALLPNYKGHFIPNFPNDNMELEGMADGEFAVLENIRFYPGEVMNDSKFAKKLAGLADLYVNDAFAVSHRGAASVVAVTKYLPSYGGFLMKKEISMLKRVSDNPKKPYVVILGGKKISTKIKLISKLARISDFILLSGGLANTFLAARGIGIGKSLCRMEEIGQANYLTSVAKRHGTKLVLPEDAIVASNPDSEKSKVQLIEAIGKYEQILDIGPKTQAIYETIISRARTILWNGPLGYFENPLFRRGTDFIYYAIEQNPSAVSIIGGGDTVTAISGKEGLEKITHVSTGGGAMLAFVENGTLIGIEALKKSAEMRRI